MWMREKERGDVDEEGEQGVRGSGEKERGAKGVR